MFSKWLEKIRNLKQTSYIFSKTNTKLKNDILYQIKNDLFAKKEEILVENRKDIDLANGKKIQSVLIERLTLNDKRINDMIQGIDTVMSLEDPVGKIIDEWTIQTNAKVQKVRVSIGVIFMIYESRPNVTVDSAVLGIKSGNCIILRGGAETINTNKVLVKVMNSAIKKVLTKNKIKLSSLPILFIDETSYDLMYKFLKLEEYIDVVIPRGGEKMIRNIKTKSLIPVLSHGSGVCHAYVDEFADIDKSIKVCLNAKVQRPSVCNAIEKLIVHKNIAEKFLPLMAKIFLDHRVKLIGCKKTKHLLKKYGIEIQLAREYDWTKEYLDLIITIKIVNSLREAIFHINKYGSHHSETIMSEDLNNQQIFCQETDSSSIFINSSTRLHDGGVFGFGTEIGISTSKLHARGTMGLNELTTTKYIIFGDGNIRN